MSSADILKAQIQADTTALIKEKKMKELTVLRSLMAEIKQFEIDKNNRAALTDAQILGVIEKMIKQRRQAIDLFLQGGRQDLVDKENFEIQLLEKYLPAPLSQNEIHHLIQEAITQSQAKAPSDMGKVMAILKPQLQGRADISQVSQLIKEALAALQSQ